MQNFFVTIKQFVILGAMYLATAMLSLALFEAPIAYVFGAVALKKSLFIILPTTSIIFVISLVITTLVLTFTCFIALDVQLKSYKETLAGSPTRLTKEQKLQGLSRMNMVFVNAILLGLTPMVSYLFLVNTNDMLSIHSISMITLDIILINITFGIVVALLYANLAQLAFQPVKAAFQLPLQGNLRSVISPTAKMAISTVPSCIMLLLLSHLFYSLNNQIYSHISSNISVSMFDKGTLANIDQEVQSTYEEVAFQYPLSLTLVWDNIEFSEYLAQIRAEQNPNNSDLNIQLQYIIKLLYVLGFFLILSVPNILNIYLLCRQFQTLIHSVFKRVRNLLKGKGRFADSLPLTTFDEIGYFIGYLNSLTMTSQKISQDVQTEGGNLITSLEVQEKNAQKLYDIVTRLEGNITQINDSVLREEEEHQVIEEGLKSVREIIFKVNGLLNNQRKYVDIIANQVNAFASLVDNVKQITEKANRESGVLAVSVGRGEDAVHNSIIGMKEIAEASEAIENIVGAITKIAAQTSLLSMNAAIEAAHAGEYGSGFAVLAQEVRSLSESATTQSRAIREQIESLIAGVESGLGISENTTGILTEISESIEQNDTFVKNIINSMTEQHQGSRDIVKSIESSVNRGSKIRNLTNHQIRKSQEIISSTLGFLQISTLIVELSKNSSESIENINHYVSEIKDAIIRNQEIAEKIVADVVTIDNTKPAKIKPASG